MAWENLGHFGFCPALIGLIWMLKQVKLRLPNANVNPELYNLSTVIPENVCEKL